MSISNLPVDFGAAGAQTDAIGVKANLLDDGVVDPFFRSLFRDGIWSRRAIRSKTDCLQLR